MIFADLEARHLKRQLYCRIHETAAVERVIFEEFKSTGYTDLVCFQCDHGDELVLTPTMSQLIARGVPVPAYVINVRDRMRSIRAANRRNQ